MDEARVVAGEAIVGRAVHLGILLLLLHADNGATLSSWRNFALAAFVERVNLLDDDPFALVLAAVLLVDVSFRAHDFRVLDDLLHARESALQPGEDVAVTAHGGRALLVVENAALPHGVQGELAGAFEGEGRGGEVDGIAGVVTGHNVARIARAVADVVHASGRVLDAGVLRAQEIAVFCRRSRRLHVWQQLAKAPDIVPLSLQVSCGGTRRGDKKQNGNRGIADPGG